MNSRILLTRYSTSHSTDPGCAQNSSSFRLGYRPSLDGLRAIAVLVVMAHHAGVRHFTGGAIGVDIFFVLSGFLITSLLEEEWQRNGRISMRNFYARRALRLLPALFMFLLVMQAYILSRMRGTEFLQMEKASLSVLAYIGNWIRALDLFDLRALDHTWSLSIEEQFYFVWPALFLLMLRGRKESKWVAYALVLAIACLAYRRALLWGVVSDARIYNGSDTRFDELLIGCALAVALGAGLLRTSRSLIYFLLPAIVTLCWLIARPLMFEKMAKYGWVIVEFSVGLLILYLVTRSNTILHRILEMPWLVGIGRMSYGLYLWHFPIIQKVGGWPLPGRLKPPIGFALTFVIAAISYHWIERPFLKRKANLQTAAPHAARAA